MHLSFIMIQKFGQSTFNKTSSDLWLPTMSGQQVPSEAPDCFCLIHITRTKIIPMQQLVIYSNRKTKWVISAGQLSSSLKSKGGRKPNLAKVSLQD
jgi:hypothetical protein